MNVLSLLASDFPEIVTAITDGTLSASKVAFEPAATVCSTLFPRDTRRPRR